jgi:hypothetical protein
MVLYPIRADQNLLWRNCATSRMVNSAAQMHGWNQPAGVNVAIIPLPSAEMRVLDAKLDAIAAKLRNRQ